MSSNNREWIFPDWPVPPTVRSLVTTRGSGFTQGRYSSFNLALHVGDDQQAVTANRRRLAESIQGEPFWLEQVHGTRVVDVGDLPVARRVPKADASFSRQPGAVCIVMTADCLPVLLCDRQGTVVAAAHAGWRGLLAGVLEDTVTAMGVSGSDLLAYFGPAIGSRAFEVGEEVRTAFMAQDIHAQEAFRPSAGKWLADIYLLARQRLAGAGVTCVFGGNFCTFSETERFFSYRRDGQTGRMASMIWLEN